MLVLLLRQYPAPEEEAQPNLPQAQYSEQQCAWGPAYDPDSDPGSSYSLCHAGRVPSSAPVPLSLSAT